ncbi:MAG: ATP-binding protein [Pseudomonadales bacterium]
MKTSAVQASEALHAGELLRFDDMGHLDAMTGGPLTVLVVEDDPLDWQLIKSYLAKMERNVNREWCSTGEEALTALACGGYDCVLVDYHLPDTRAEDLIEPLRLTANDPWLPIIVISGRGKDESAAAVIKKGAADYLPKSRLNAQSLTRALSNALVQARLSRMLESERRNTLELNKRLVRQNREVASFYHTVSHELKTPLTAVREFCSLLDDEVLGPVNTSQQEALQTSISCCDRLVRLIGDLFDTARVETGKLELHRGWFDLPQLLQEEARIMGPRAHAAEIELSVECPEALPALYADRVRMAQVVSNLMSNAVKFTPAGGRVTVRGHFREADAALMFSVIDNGPGIPVEQTDFIFDRLYQGDTDQAGSENGMGIGLFLCSEIVRLHDGEIEVQSVLGEGSVFYVAIPLLATNTNTAVAQLRDSDSQ